MKPEGIPCAVCVYIEAHKNKTTRQMNHYRYQNYGRGTTSYITGTTGTLNGEGISHVTTVIFHTY